MSEVSQEQAQSQGLVELCTERLRMREITLDDVDAVVAFCNDREIARGTCSIPHPYTHEHAKGFVGDIARKINENEAYCWGIEVVETGELIGDIGIWFTPAHRRAEVGFVIGRDHWGKGYVPEALNEVIRYGFEDLGLHRIFAHAMAWNNASRRVMEKVGMVHEGTLKEDHLKWGRFESSAIYGFTRDDWESFHASKQG
ncbi:MAG: GNAT family N-acetyltransferase [Phycisphaerales bacterium JB043]